MEPKPNAHYGIDPSDREEYLRLLSLYEEYRLPPVKPGVAA